MGLRRLVHSTRKQDISDHKLPSMNILNYKLISLIKLPLPNNQFKFKIQMHTSSNIENLFLDIKCDINFENLTRF